MTCHLKFEEGFARYAFELFKISMEERAEVGCPLYIENGLVTIGEQYVVGDLYHIPVEDLFDIVIEENKLYKLFGYIHTHIVKDIPFPGVDDLGVGLLAGLTLGLDEFYCATVVGKLPDKCLTLIVDCIETVKSVFPIHVERIKSLLDSLYSAVRKDREVYGIEYSRSDFFRDLIVLGTIQSASAEYSEYIEEYFYQLEKALQHLVKLLESYIVEKVDRSKPWLNLRDFYKKDCILIYVNGKTVICTMKEYDLRFR